MSQRTETDPTLDSRACKPVRSRSAKSIVTVRGQQERLNRQPHFTPGADRWYLAACRKGKGHCTHQLHLFLPWCSGRSSDQPSTGAAAWSFPDGTPSLVEWGFTWKPLWASRQAAGQAKRPHSDHCWNSRSPLRRLMSSPTTPL